MRLNTLYECWNIHGFASFWWRRLSENPYSTSMKRYMYSIHGDACIIDLVHCDAEDCTNSLYEFKRFIGSIHFDPGDCLSSFHECWSIHWFKDCVNPFHESRKLHWFGWLCFWRLFGFILAYDCLHSLLEYHDNYWFNSLSRFIFNSWEWFSFDDLRVRFYLRKNNPLDSWSLKKEMEIGLMIHLEVLSSRVSSERLSIMVKYQQIV